MSSPISHGPNTAPTHSSGGNAGKVKMFLASNNNITKFAFIILILIIFIALYHLGVFILDKLFGPKQEVYLTKTINDASQYFVIKQDPNEKGSITVNRSDNKRNGIEFSWSVWLYIKPTDPQTSRELLHVFHKGNNDFDETTDTTKLHSFQTGMNWPNNAPGLYIDWKKNQFVIVMNTYEDILETIYVPDIPLNKWVNVIIRCQQNVLDVYINGSVVKRYELTDVPKQNYGNVFLTANNGFSGYTSELRYFAYALSPGKIVNIAKTPPKKSNNTMSTYMTNDPPYLSLRWYFGDNNAVVQ
tara:strand:- start:441 stop:1340 length:900 start_codon:yes stop_codon:yes gene_type:complete